MSVGLVAVVAVSLLAGCAPARNVAEGEQKKARGPLVFPEPPDEPRFVFERRISSALDVTAITEDDRLRNLLTGEQVRMQGLVKPYAVAVHKGRVFVTDSAARYVHVFDVPAGKYSQVADLDEGTLQKPLGVDVDRRGRLYVADATLKTVIVFDEAGKYLKKIGGPKEFDRLSSVTVNPEGTRVYVVDIGGVASQHHRVRVFDVETGDFLMDIGKRGAGPGEFNLPRDLAIGKDGRLYVVDGGNFRVQVFDRDGKYLTSFGKVGRQLGDFARPKEIAADRDGNIYVADAAFGNFQIFGPEGDLLLFVGGRSERDAPARYMLPSGIFVDEDGRVYMVDQWFRKLEVFRPYELGETAGYLVESSRKPKPGK